MPLQSVERAPSVAAAPALAPRRDPSRAVSAIIVEYTSAGEEQKRRDLIWELLDAPPADGVAGVDRMLQVEKRGSLRIELFDALESFPGSEPAKIDILKREIPEIRQRGDVFDAALDALLNVQHRDAIPVWNKLAEKGDDEIKDVARSAIQALESLPK